MFTNKERQSNDNPQYVILADIYSKQYIRSFDLINEEILYGKIKKLYHMEENLFRLLIQKLYFLKMLYIFLGENIINFQKRVSRK